MRQRAVGAHGDGGWKKTGGQNSNPDLFWAIRGVGGNFGVATALEYQLHQVSEILVNALRENLQPFSRGLNANKLSDTSGELVRTAYGANYARLVEIKKKYDPTNVLRLNPNIRPDRLSNN